MDRIQKLNSKQGNFQIGAGATKLNCDFTIPSGGVYNMKDSYLNIAVKLGSTDTNNTENMPTATAGNGIHALTLKFIDSVVGNNALMPNVGLVKNAFMSGANVGKIDDVRRVDALKTAFSVFERDINQDEDATYYGLTTATGDYQLCGTPYISMEKTGSNKSSYKTNNVKIKMSDIFDICNETQLDTNKTGNLDIHLELNLDKINVAEIGGSADTAWTTNPARQAVALGKMENQTGSATQDGTLLVSSIKYSPKEFKEAMPFWVGQRLAITATGGTGTNGGAFTDHERTVESITYDNTTGAVNLVLDKHLNTVALVAGDTNTGITVKSVGLDEVSSTVEKIEMVLHQVSNPQNVPTSYSYFTYPLEQDNSKNIS